MSRSVTHQAEPMCQASVGVGQNGHALIDRELYLPRCWADDSGRCQAAGIPQEVEFATKPRQAQAMIGRAITAGVPFAWFTADETYGQAKFLQAWLEDQGVSCVMAIGCSDTLTVPEGEQRAGALIAAVPSRAWQRISAGPGRTGCGSSIGPGSRSGPGGARDAGTGCWPAGRWRTRPRSPYYACYGPRRSSTADLAWIAASRQHIEECFQQAKNEAGLDHYQVRSWRAW